MLCRPMQTPLEKKEAIGSGSVAALALEVVVVPEEVVEVAEEALVVAEDLEENASSSVEVEATEREFELHS